MLIDRVLITFIADDVITRIDDDTKQWLIEPPKKAPSGADAIVGVALLQSFQRWVKNSYDFWTKSPLTKRWREEGPDDMRDGIDYSADHPDNLANTIIELVQEKLRAELPQTHGMTDAVGDPLRIGAFYGYTTSDGKFQTSVTGELLKVKPTGLAQLSVLRRRQFKSGKPHTPAFDDWGANKIVNIRCPALFPIK